VLRLRGSVLLEQGDLTAAKDDLEASLASYRAAGSRRGVAYTLRTLGLHHRAVGEYEAAVQACEDAAAIFTELGDDLMRSYAVRARAKAQLRLGLAELALPQLEWALSVACAAGDRWGQSSALHVLAELHLAERRPGLARGCAEAALALWQQIRAPLWAARTRLVLAAVSDVEGDPVGRCALSEEAYRVFRDHGSREWIELHGARPDRRPAPDRHEGGPAPGQPATLVLNRAADRS
jgi:tetratricopeptide (TPR) repeat protein